MKFLLVDFIVMDMGSETSSPIILGRIFFRTRGVVIDSKEENIKFQLPHKKCEEHFPRKNIAVQRHNFPHNTFPS
jgi:hypothetical protein